LMVWLKVCIILQETTLAKVLRLNSLNEFILIPFCNFSACRRTLLRVGVLVYYTSKDIGISSVCLIPRRKNPALLILFIIDLSNLAFLLKSMN
jgi:hypothetical protein